MSPDQFVLAVEEVFPGSRVSLRSRRVTGTVMRHGRSYPVSAQFAPRAEIEVAIPRADGFRLEISWGAPGRLDRSIGIPEVDAAYRVRSNDASLARCWLDDECQRWLLGQHTRAKILSARRVEEASKPWTLRLEEKVVRVSGSTEVATEHAIAALAYACVVAGRPDRWAASCAALAPMLGCDDFRVVDRVALGCAAFVVEILGTEIEVSYVRRGRWGRSPRLETRFAVQLPADTSISLRQVARRHPNLRLTLRDTVLAAWFEGALMNAVLIQPVLTALAEIAVAPRRTQGPYR